MENDTSGELVKIKHASVFCSWIDNQQDKTLVLLHGNSSSGRFWEPLMAGSLQHHFNFLVFDLPGHGQSPVPENPEETYSLPAYADILSALIERYMLTNYWLCGHSLGGHIVLEALESLNNCKGAFIMGTPPFMVPPRLELAFQMSPQFISFMQAGEDRSLLEDTFKSMVSEDKTAPARLLFEDYFSTDPQARKLLIENIRQGKFIDEVKVLQNTRVPVYIIKAEKDQMVNAAYFDQFFSGIEVISIPGAGHYAPLEKPDTFENVILGKFSAHLV